MSDKQREISTAVITGPTGAIGTALVRRMIQDDVQVYAVVRPGSRRLSTLPEHPNVHIVQLDVSELARLPEFIPAGADAFYHLAWRNTEQTGRNNVPAQISNISFAVEAVWAAAALGCKVFIGAGSQAEYGWSDGILRPDTPCFPRLAYGMAKLCAGQMSRLECQNLKIDHIWTRFLSVYGPGIGMDSVITSVIQQLLDGEKPSLTEGSQIWDYLFADDAAEAAYLLGEYGVSGKTYVIGSDSARPVKEYIEILRDAVDPTLPLGFGEKPYAPQQLMHLEADISELQADTGFRPKTDFAEGMRIMVDWMREGLCK